MTRQPRRPASLGRKLLLGALAGIAVATVAVSVLGRSCSEPQAASSADSLLRGSAQTPAAPQVSPPAALSGRANPKAPSAVKPSLLKGGSGSRKVVAIAFQLRAVPGRPGGVDRALIDALNTDDATATFFMAGLWAQAHSSVAAELARMPHVEIGNGGYSAEYLRKLPADVTRQRTQLAQEAIRSATGVTPTVYRDAQVAYDTKSIDAIAALGMRPVSGDIDLTSVAPSVSSVGMSQMALGRVRPGSIIVLDGDGSDSRAARVFVRLLGGLTREGYTLVTVSGLTD